MVKIAVATQGLILVRTAHNDLYIRVLASITEESRSSIGTLTAECSKPQNTVCERNAVKNLTKLASIGIAIQTHEIHVLAMRIHCPLNERNQVLEKLRLIDNDDPVGCNIYLVQIARMDTRRAATIVRCNNSLTIPLVRLMCND
jgi:hypothetical protein